MVVIGSACTSETTESMQWSTGTYFLWRQRVIDHFNAIDFGEFDFVYAHEFVDANTPNLFVVLAVDGSRVKAEVQSMFSTFDGSSMFPSHITDWQKFEVRFESEAESLTITFLHRSSTDGSVSFLHANAAGLIESQYYPYSAFPEEIAMLLNLFAGGRDL